MIDWQRFPNAANQFKFVKPLFSSSYLKWIQNLITKDNHPFDRYRFMTNLEDFRTITIILPEWAYKMVPEIAAFGCVSVDHLMSLSIRVALFDLYNESNEKNQFFSFTDTWSDIREELSGQFKCLKRCLSGEKIARPGSSIDLTLDTPHKVSISLRSFWIHLIEEQVGTDSEKVAQRIAEIVTKSIQEMAYAEQVHYPS